MDVNDLKNGTALSSAPVQSAHPDVIRQAQFLVDQANAGKIVGFEAIGVCPDGNTIHLHAVPQTASAIQLAIGALQVLIGDLVGTIQSMRNQQAGVSRILRPTRMQG